MSETFAESAPKSPETEVVPKKRPVRPDVYPVLERLAVLYQKLFGTVFVPLKRGIFQDILAAHPDAFERDALKAALSFHTRSTRYLTAVASGQQRHDLQGVAVESMAPEHVYQALLEVFRRRQARTRDDLSPKLVERMVHAFEVSGLSAQAYTERVHGHDDEANALLQCALTEAQVRQAKNEALLRAFEGSGVTEVDTFADMYGMDPRVVTHMLERARAMLGS